MSAAPRPTIELPAGVRLRYTERGAAGGEAILCLHGYSDSAYSFAPLLFLVPPAFRTVAVDQRGHGDSDRPPDGYDIGTLAADACAALDALGIRRATVVGHSMGSLVAQRLALDHPDRVGRLVLVGSGTSAVNAVTLALAEEVRRLSDPVPAEFVRDFQRSTVHEPLPEAFLDRIVAESLKLPARVWHAVLDGILAFDAVAELPRIGCPTLIVWGEHDGIFDRDEQHRLRAAIPDARLVVYHDTGHSPNWERPAQLVDDVLAFIAESRHAAA